jgi:hypothetical protein
MGKDSTVGVGNEYGPVPMNPKSSPHDGRTPVNPAADIPMEITKTTESIPDRTTGFQPRTA